MSYRTLITAEQLLALQARAEPLVVLDCSFDLADTAAAERAFAGGHLPGAQYVHLDNDMAGEKTGGNGRHPLPRQEALALTAGRLGIAPGVQVVAYDAQGGPYAARAWWLLRWLGHTDVAVLDGGKAAWQAAGGEWVTMKAAAMPASAAYPAAAVPAMPTLDADALLNQLGRVRLVDARAAERFRGDVEPLDPVAGHIPGARQRFFKDNLLPDGRFKPAAQLHAEFVAFGADAGGKGGAVVHACGSGVTACNNLLAMAHAGFGDTALYPGSWSEWCSDPSRPVERGSNATAF